MFPISLSSPIVADLTSLFLYPWFPTSFNLYSFTPSVSILPGVRRKIERVTRDMTPRMTTMAIPIPFQFRGGPPVLPRSCSKNKIKVTALTFPPHTHSLPTAEGECISAASFALPQSRDFMWDVCISAATLPGRTKGLHSDRNLCHLEQSFIKPARKEFLE